MDEAEDFLHTAKIGDVAPVAEDPLATAPFHLSLDLMLYLFASPLQLLFVSAQNMNYRSLRVEIFRDLSPDARSSAGHGGDFA
jgi:hypothetical protein